ncbi:MAG: hydroxymyristoyl-ACP dehydratase [Burkholderiales bacterium]|jgi:predicted hotdog family 3-hydroxylacyl-ACP dehydratase
MSEPSLPGASIGPATLDRDGIAARIPHSGSMCLLESLLSWNADYALCRATSHQDANNPLRSPGGLLAPVAIEYASQVMALHGALTAVAGQAPSAGFLAAARGVNLHVARLDDVPGPLQVSVTRLAGAEAQALYRFELHDEAGRLLVDGRATVVLNTPLTSAPSTP